MLGIVAAAVGIGAAVVYAYHLGVQLTQNAVTQEAARHAEASAEAMPRATLPGTVSPATLMAPGAATPADVAKTDAWTRQYVPQGVPLVERLKLMRAIFPVKDWPAYAVRVAREMVQLYGML